MVKYLSLILFIVSYSLQSQILTLTTSSKNSAWTPTKVVKTGQPLSWKATATGMTTQTATGIPVFDLSLPRTSPVTITATSNDGTNSFTELAINSLNIMSLIITNAESLTSLSCTDNQLKSLDITNNTKLTKLLCHSNQLAELVVNKNTELTNLACFFNSITVLDLSQNTLLSKLSCSNNQLKDLDLSKNNNLTSLECDMNLLENLNVQNGNNTIIESFKTTENTNLLCIQVDDVNYSAANWKDIDSWTNFNVDCTFTNEIPKANDDQYETPENTTLIIDAIGVLINDIDPDGDKLTAILEANTSNGILNFNSDGSFTYSPNQNFYGSDFFTYKANDGEFDSNIATVSIDVILVNEPPVSKDNSYQLKENTILDINENEGVLSNDTDPDGDLLTADLVSDVNNGSLILNANGSFTYTPHQDFLGSDSFVYQAFDGFAYSNESIVKIDVIPKFDIIVPNAFTPNNDNINDFFKPVYKGMNNVLLAIYDTWSNLIYYEESNLLIGWDGNINGKNAENGNYLYKISAYPIEGEKIELNGLFTLIK